MDFKEFIFLSVLTKCLSSYPISGNSMQVLNVWILVRIRILRAALCSLAEGPDCCCRGLHNFRKGFYYTPRGLCYLVADGDFRPPCHCFRHIPHLSPVLR
jgi:hypothetical protein